MLALKYNVPTRSLLLEPEIVLELEMALTLFNLTKGLSNVREAPPKTNEPVAKLLLPERIVVPADTVVTPV